MSAKTYEFYKNKFNNTVPIRGRDVEVRPIGQRRRDWEKVTRKDLGDGTFAYCAKLYDTECVEYHPDGSVVLRVNGWVTPSTAEFIHEHSPFVCFKHNNKLWVRNAGQAGDKERGKLYPLTNEPLRFKWLGEHNYEPAVPVLIKKQVVNRIKAAAAREPIVPFLDWTRVFLTMSDGWVMHETRKQVFGWDDEKKEFKNPYGSGEKKTYERLVEVFNDESSEEVYMDTLCRWADEFGTEKRIAKAHTRSVNWNGQQFNTTANFYDIKVDFSRLKRRVYKWVERYAQVHDVIEVEPSNKAMTKVL